MSISLHDFNARARDGVRRAWTPATPPCARYRPGDRVDVRLASGHWHPGRITIVMRDGFGSRVVCVSPAGTRTQRENARLDGWPDSVLRVPLDAGRVRPALVLRY